MTRGGWRAKKGHEGNDTMRRLNGRRRRQADREGRVRSTLEAAAAVGSARIGVFDGAGKAGCACQNTRYRPMSVPQLRCSRRPCRVIIVGAMRPREEVPGRRGAFPRARWCASVERLPRMALGGESGGAARACWTD
eukprot:scaffold1198_cov116-Isochrysis_galbana.AAC.9